MVSIYFALTTLKKEKRRNAKLKTQAWRSISFALAETPFLAIIFISDPDRINDESWISIRHPRCFDSIHDGSFSIAVLFVDKIPQSFPQQNSCL